MPLGLVVMGSGTSPSPVRWWWSHLTMDLSFSAPLFLMYSPMRM